MSNIRWAPIVAAAAAWVESQQYSVSLRQVFYFLVSRQLVPNSETVYKGLSAKTSEARREGEFPALSDGTREILELAGYLDLSEYAAPAANGFHLDRTAGQDYQVVIGVEKRGMVNAAWQQFGARGFSVVALGGYSSATIDMDLAERLEADGRPSVLLYAGDFDCSGEDIYRNLIEQVYFDFPLRVALSAEQVAEYDLPINPGKPTDSRAKAFEDRHGVNVQVEVDALPPDVLAGLFEDAVTQFWDESAFDAVVARELLLQRSIREAIRDIGRDETT